MKKHQDESDIRIGIIGIGAMGKGLLYQSRITAGILTAAVCDVDAEKACKALGDLGIGYAFADDQAGMEQINKQGKVAVFRDGAALAAAGGMDAVIEATGTVVPGGEYCVGVLTSGKHLILMNSEADLIFGSYLSRLADMNHVVCTSCDGDQYGVLKHLIDELRSWGFELVMAGSIKGFLDRYANPATIVSEADKRNLDYRACTSYTDGTKLNIEMALISNALGLPTKTPGMHGPVCGDVENVGDVLDLETLWKDRIPFVDYVLGAKPGGGVFAVGYCDHPYQRDMLKYYKMGNGPFYTFYKPYHLCHIEAMATVVDAVKDRKALLRPEHGFVTNVYAYAKKDLKKGDELDGIGGYACYGLIENCSAQGDTPGIPICLADKVFLKKDMMKDEKILLQDVLYDPQRQDFAMFDMAMEKGGPS